VRRAWAASHRSPAFEAVLLLCVLGIAFFFWRTAGPWAGRATLADLRQYTQLTFPPDTRIVASGISLVWGA